MPRELAVTFLNEIGSKLQECERADEEFKASLLAKLEKTRQCGISIEAARADLDDHEFRALLQELGLSKDAVQSFVSFARKHSEPVTDLRFAMKIAVQAAMATGLLPAAPGHSHQVIHAPNVFSKMSFAIQKMAAEFAKYLNRRPLSDWPIELKEQVCASMLPLLRIHKAIRLSMGKDK